MRHIIFSICLTILLTLSLDPAAHPALAQEKSATEAVRQRIDAVIAILKSPEYESEEKKEAQRQAILDQVENFFDFEKISQLALGRFRRQFSDEQMKTFVELFTDLLAGTYLKQVQEEFENEKVDYLEEIAHPSDKERAMVKTLVYRKGHQIPVDYSMYVREGDWRVYDVKVEGVSLVKNYRTQFEKILLNKSPDILVEKLREKSIDTDAESEEKGN